MDTLTDFLNQPIVLTLITLSFGGYLVTAISDRRARKDKLTEKAIEFLTDTGNDLNSVISAFYAGLRTGKPLSGQSRTEAFTRLFAKRMSVRIGSEAYLRSDEFWRHYDDILHELEGVSQFLADRPKHGHSKKIISQIQDRRSRLRKAWPIPNETPRPNVESSTGESMLSVDMIIDHTTQLLSANLRTVLH